MEDQTIGWRTRILNEGSFWITKRQERYVSSFISFRRLPLNLYRPLAEENERRAPITVKFEIPYFTVSGIQVRYLKIVEKSGYQALPWVRYTPFSFFSSFTFV
jgi:hypothetical protein